MALTAHSSAAVTTSTTSVNESSIGTGLPLRVMVTLPLMGSTDTLTEGESAVVSSSSRSRNSAISDRVTIWSGEKVVAEVPGINPR